LGVFEIEVEETHHADAKEYLWDFGKGVRLREGGRMEGIY
jgi:hypothetical protein